MDVTPRELRDTEIKEAFRGYHRDEVDELLERAAATIERMSERVRQVSDRVSDFEGGAPPRNREAEETLQRTLILAQRTADEAVNDANQRARKMLEEAEVKSRSMVVEAETNARQIAESERRRLEAEIHDLSGRRDSLLIDVDALERYEGDYRNRIRSALENELETLSSLVTSRVSNMGPRPSIHEVELPRPSEPGRGGPPTAEISSLPPFPDAGEADYGEPGPAPEWGGAAARPSDDPITGELAAFVSDEPIEAEILDDDAFFASLRDAVRDDSALGPSDEPAQGDAVYDQDDADEGERRRFRKRR
jgi:cell division initiation protein